MSLGSSAGGTSGTKRSTMIIGAIVLVGVMLSSAVILGQHEAPGEPGGDTDLTGSGPDGGNDRPIEQARFIWQNNSGLAIGLDDLPPGWTIGYDYGPWGDNVSMGSEEAGSIVFKFVDAGNAKAEYMSVFLFRFDCPDKAALYFQNTYRSEGVDHWQGVDISTVGPIDIGDEAILCSGNWTGSMGAIKTVVFRDYNVIGIIVHEAAWQVGLTDEATIGMARLQHEKLMV